MCGIFGFVVKENSDYSYDCIRKILERLFILSETRGKESSGIAVYNSKKKSINVFKKAIPASRMIRTLEYKSFYNKAFEDAFDDGLQVPLAAIGHSRLVTNGTQEFSYNNQPVIKNGIVGVHNGIIVNVGELWERFSPENREFEVDTEVMLYLIRYFLNKRYSLENAISETFKLIYGMTSTALLLNDRKEMILATNNGSLYIAQNSKKDIIIFASERYILESLFSDKSLKKAVGDYDITNLSANKFITIDINSLMIRNFELNGNEAIGKTFDNDCVPNDFQIINMVDDDKKLNKNTRPIDFTNEDYLKGLLEDNEKSVSELKRCTKCILPETFPFIEFDSDGVCNYCNNYSKVETIGEEKLKKLLDEYKKNDGLPDCLATFSGGRDSSYGLHYIKTQLKLNPIAYTYDWGMVTDLARRNQARLCGKLGIEHILVSADINKKRNNIRKNVSAWLKRPRLGTIPLFMAGDKQYFYYANKLGKQNNIKLIVLCENPLEKTDFKTGFCGIRPSFNKNEHIYSLSIINKLKMILYYAKEYLFNPAYINSSILDTFYAFMSYYFLPHNYINIFKYIEWDEKEVEKILLDEYLWETSPDTPTTWRIGDGTAAFYNYIYYNVAGFSEFDTFRSNQIREGKITREKALQLVNEENKPRYESIKWYLDTINLDFESTIKTINKVPKLYKKTNSD